MDNENSAASIARASSANVPARARWSDWSRANLAALVLLVIGIALSSQYYGNGVNMPMLFYVVLLISAALLCVLYVSLGDGVIWRQHRWAVTLLAAYLLLCIINVFVSQVSEISFLHVWMRAAVPIGAFIALHLIATQRQGMQTLIWVMIGFALIGALWGVQEFVHTPQRINGPFVDANNLALLCVFGFLLLLPQLFVVGRSSRVQVFTWAILAILTFGVFATFSRAIIVVWAAAVVLLLMLRLWRKESARGMFVIAALGVASYVITTLSAPHAGSRYTKAGDFTLGVDVRVAMWRAVLDMWHAHPWLGSGIGTFRVLYPTHRLLLDQFTGGNSPHNDYLQLLFEGGPLMVGFLVLALVTSVYVGGRWLVGALRRDETPDWQRIGVVLAIGAVLAHASVNFISIVLVWQMLLGCALAALLGRYVATEPQYAVTRAQNAAPTALMAPREQVLFTALCAALLLLPLRSLAVDAVSYAVFLRQPGVPFAADVRNDGATYLRVASTLENLAPTRGLPPYGQAFYYHLLSRNTPPQVAANFAKLAKQGYARSMNNFPYTLRVVVAYAELCTLPVAEDLPLAEQLARRATQQDPTDVTPFILLAQVLQRENREHAAYLVLRDGMFPWALLNIVGYPQETEGALKQLRTWSAKYGEGPDPARLTQLVTRAEGETVQYTADVAKARARRAAALAAQAR